MFTKIYIPCTMPITYMLLCCWYPLKKKNVQKNVKKMYEVVTCAHKYDGNWEQAARRDPGPGQNRSLITFGQSYYLLQGLAWW